MSVVFRLLSLLTSARNARETIEGVRHSVAQVKATAEGFRTAAFQRTLEKARNGEAAAQYELGEHYYDGRGVPRDFAESFHWFRQAAEQGHAKARTNLGMMCFLGRGVERNPIQGYLWLRLAALDGEEVAVKACEKARQKLSAEQLAQAEQEVQSALRSQAS